MTTKLRTLERAQELKELVGDSYLALLGRAGSEQQRAVFTSLYAKDNPERAKEILDKLSQHQ